MRISQLLKRWAKITGQDYTNMRVEDIPTVEYNLDMKQWMLRKCDREDYLDWMPYCLISDYKIRTYYVNVNPLSVAHAHTLVLSIDGRSAVIDEWNGTQLISSRGAAVESNPLVKPTNDESIAITEYLEKITSRGGKI